MQKETKGGGEWICLKAQEVLPRMKGKEAEDLSWGRILEMGNGCFLGSGTGNDVKECEREPAKGSLERGYGE